MEKRILEQIIQKIRTLREEAPTMSTGSTAGKPGFSGSADAKGPVAGFDPVMRKKKKYIYGGRGSRKIWKDHLDGRR